MLKLVLIVQLNKLHRQKMTVPPWELPILQAIHGEKECELIGEEFVDTPYPDPSDEYQRLTLRYKAPAEDPEKPYVGQLFGLGPVGINRLGDLIAEAEANEVEQIEDPRPVDGIRVEPTAGAAPGPAPAPASRARAPRASAKKGGKKGAAAKGGNPNSRRHRAAG